MTHGHETQTQSHETAEQIAAAFEGLQFTLMGMVGDPEFAARYMQARPKDALPMADIYDESEMRSPTFWRVFKDYAVGSADRPGAIDTGEDTAASSVLERDALKLLAATPYYLFAQAHLDQKRAKGEQAAPGVTEVTSEFNGMIRAFASTYRATKVKTVETALLGIAHASLGKTAPGVAAGAQHQIEAALQGARHELSLMEVVRRLTGITSREATPAEDVKGIDAVIIRAKKWLGIDAKASDAKIRTNPRKHPHLPYAPSPTAPGTIMMCIPWPEKVFDGTFFPVAATEDEMAGVEAYVENIVDNAFNTTALSL